MKDCTCPVILITCHPGHVSEEQARRVADEFNAQVTLEEIGGGRTTMWGEHRADCDIYSLRDKVRAVRASNT